MSTRERGFALPTVVISSVILLGVLAIVIGSASSSRSAISTQYYQSLARNAAEAGTTFAKQCVTTNYGTATTSQWSNSGSVDLRTGDDCFGVELAGANCSTASPNLSLCYVSVLNNIRTRFVVSPAVVSTTTYTLVVTGYVEVMGVSSNTVNATYTTTQRVRASVDTRYGIASGNDTVCSIQAGKLYCWGKNDNGQVGTGVKDVNDVTVPTAIQGGLANKYVISVATGIYHTCAIAGSTPNPSSMTSVYCWGENSTSSRQYGDNSAEVYSPPATPQLTLTGRYATSISARDHNCILAPTTDNSARHVYCWGENGNYQAGESSSGGHPDPKLTSDWRAVRDTGATTLTDVQQINSINGGSSCGINDATNGYVYCMGNADYGMLGTGVSGSGNDSDRANWVVMYNTSTKLGKATKIVTNNGRACALSYYATNATVGSNRAVWCWGSNMNYGVGTGPDWRVDSSVWSAITVRTKATRVHSTAGTTCLYDASVGTGSYDCATIAAAGKTATKLYNADATDIALSDWNICLLVSGIVYCSGYNLSGQLGQGNTLGPDGNPSVAVGTATAASQVRSANEAVPVLGLLKDKVVMQVVGGNNHFCAITTEHTVFCWGSNGNGQIGDGTRTNALSPTQASMQSDIVY